MVILLLLLLGSYLLGSVPTAVWLSRAVYGQDIRTQGSRNAGSTNMYRVHGFRGGFPVQVIDIAKGSIAAALPLLVQPQLYASLYPGGMDGALPVIVFQLGCGLAAVLGHVYTVFAGFKGGKGVNSILGMMLVIEPLGSLVGVLVFVAVLLLGRMVSLASMVAVSSFTLYLLVRRYAAAPGADWLASYSWLLPLGLLLAAGVVYTHRANITRIRQGTESKVGFLEKKKK